MSDRATPAAAGDPLGLTSRGFWTWFAGLLALASLPVILAPLPPLFDYPNHLARMYLLIHQPGSEVLQRFYEIRWRPLPNLAMDLVVPLLARVMPLAWAGKAFILACFALLAGGAAALQRAATGRWSAWPLFAFLFLYSRVFLWGFLNYLFGIGLALVALALWIALGERIAILRVAIAAGFALALFFAHLMACVVYGILIAGFELGRLWHDRPRAWPAALGRLVAAGMPFLPPAAIWWLAGEGDGSAIAYGRFARKLDLLFSVFDNYHRVFDVASFATLVAVAAWAYGRRLLVLTPALGGPLALLALAYLLAPAQLMTASAVDHRLPLVIAAVLAAATTAPSLRPRVATTIAIAGLALFAARMAAVGVAWQRSDAIYARRIAILDEVPEGSRLAVAFPPGTISSAAIPEAHLPSLAIVDRNAFVPTLFAYRNQQPVVFTPEYRQLAERSEPGALWQALVEGDRSAGGTLDILARYDAVVVLAPHPFSLPPMAPLRPIAVEPDFALYRVVH